MSARSRHEWVRTVLGNWAVWVSQRGLGGLGYSSINILARIGGRSASADHVPIGVQQAEAVDQAMRVLRRADGRGWLVVMLQYVGDPRVPQQRRRPMATSEAAALLGACVDSVIRWRVGAEQELIDMLARDRRV